MSVPERHDDDLRALLRPLRAAEPAEDRPRPDLDRAIAQASEPASDRRRCWRRRFGPPTGLVVGLLVVSAAAATATGVLSFGGLAETVSQDDMAATELRGLMGQLDQQPDGENRLFQTGSIENREPIAPDRPSHSGRVTRDGLDIQISLSPRRMCLMAPGDLVVGRDYHDLRGHRDVNRRIDPRRLEEIPRARDLLKNPHQYACVATGHLDERFPAITGFDGQRSWLVALAPDQVKAVRATATDGQEHVFAVAQNIAAGHAGHGHFTRIQWLDTDGQVRWEADPTTATGRSVGE